MSVGKFVFRKIENVTAQFHELENGDLLYVTLDKRVKRVGEISWEIRFEGFLILDFIAGGMLFCRLRREDEIRERFVCYSVSDGKIVVFGPDENALPFYSENGNNNILLKSVGKDRKRFVHLVNLMTEETIWIKQIDISSPLYVKSQIIALDRLSFTTIESYSINNGDSLWKFDCKVFADWEDYDKTKKITKISTILGVYDEIIWVILNNGELLLLDVNSGTKKGTMINDKNINDTYLSGWFRQGLIHMDEKQGKLIQLADQFYTEVDLQTREVSHQEVRNMVYEDLQNKSAFCFNEENIYFIDTTNFKMGVLARKTLKITWSYTFDQSDLDLKKESPRMPQGLKLAENSVYVLDNKGALHVFGKEGSGVELN